MSLSLNAVLGLYIVVLQGSRDSFAYLYEHRGEEISMCSKEIEGYMNELDILVKINHNLMEEINTENIKLYTIYSHMRTKNKEIADMVRLASKITNIDELLLVALINSESSFVVGVKHSLDYVVGLGGINTKYWKYPVDTVEEQIFATALVLQRLLELSNGNYLDALHYYKGRSPLGLRQAEHVLKLYYSYKDDAP